MATEQPTTPTPDPTGPDGRAPLPWERPAYPSTATTTASASPDAGPAVEGSYWVAPTEAPVPVAPVKLGGYLPRVLAYLVDGIFVGTWILLVITVVPIGPHPDTAVTIAVLVLALFGFVYFPWCWTHGGRTVGMRMFGIRVVRDPDAGPVTWGRALLRLFGYWVNSFVFYVGWIWIFIDKRRRGFHDMMGRTIVVDEASWRAFQERAGKG